MHAASRGLFVAFAIIGLAWLYATQIAHRVFPDIGRFGAVVVVGGPFILAHGIALAVFWGSSVCAGRALYTDSTSRTFGGYMLFALSAIPTLVLSYAWFRLMVIGH
jgi:hypothetical protein